MRVIFERTGGFMGRKVSLTVDLQELPADQAEALRSLIEESNFMALDEDIAASSAPDEFHYSVTVETDKLHHTVRTTDMAAPTPLRPLIQELTQLSRTRPA